MTTTALDVPPVSALPEPTTTRWQPLRAGLQNVWQYDHTTRFVFHRGRLLLRGRNGSGKTKVVELLLPFLLEGKLSPERLDPFGTRSRKMHYNLLHDGNRDVALSVGYVWLELGRVDEDGHPRYATVGAGLKARRSSDGVESWFFVTTRRPDVDLDLVAADRTPVSRPHLEESLGDDGHVYTSARDYRTAVNRELFGLSDEQYGALVEALLRLRQPHLSEKLDPAQVGAVLSDSLPPLDAERVHEVAEGFERLEAHRRDLADRRRALEAVSGFLDVYSDYVRTVAAVRARDLSQADSAVRGAAEDIAAAQRAFDEAHHRATVLDDDLARVESDLAAAAARISTLETSDEYRAVSELEEAERQAGRAVRLAQAAERQHREELTARAAATSHRDAIARQVDDQAVVLADSERTAAVRAAEADLRVSHDGVVALLDAGGGDAAAARGAAAAIRADRRTAIARVRAEETAVDAAAAARRRTAERAEDAAEAERQAGEGAAVADGAVSAALDGFWTDVAAWRGGLEVLDLDGAPTADIDPTEVEPVVRAASGPVRRAASQDVADAALRLADAKRAAADTAAERDALAAATHRPPLSPPWRGADREAFPGAPLYLLAELTDELDGAAQANVEAALGAAGLLDAWVTPDGRVLDPGLLDIAAVAGPPVPGRTLADVALPTPSGGVPAEVVTAILARVALVEVRAQQPDRSAAAVPDTWVATDGRFGLGPLRGAAAGTAVAFLGEGARARARARRLAELETQLADLRAAVAAAGDHAAETERRLTLLEAEIGRLPGPASVLAARAEAGAAARALGAARQRHQEAFVAHAAAVEAGAAAARRRDDVAADVGLLAHVGALDALTAATEAWHAAVTEAAAALVTLVERSSRGDDADRALTVAAHRANDAAAAGEDAARARAVSAERAATLRAMVGSTRDELLAALADARATVERLSAHRRSVGTERQHVAEQIGGAAAARDAAAATHDRLETTRSAAAAAFRQLAVLGLLRHVLDEMPEDPDSWGSRAALEQARRVDRDGLPTAAEAAQRMVEAGENSVGRKQQELLRDLVAGIRMFGRKDGGVLVHDLQYQGRTYRLGELVDELRDDVVERDRRLATDEQEVLETFLSGELHEHLRVRLRDAEQLVRVMNAKLADCPTPAGQRVRLSWDIADDAPAGTRSAVDLLLRGVALLTDDQRRDLRTFLHDRLREAREGEAAASLYERIATAFDYRRWYSFTVQFRDAATPTWRRLTRQSHGTGSGGEKAVMLHLPLFAAMAAHYQASPTAPRLIVLDEVFAGIDRGTRGQLMRLLVALDLDALLTSHEEWGFYAELDGVSTYHLIRDPAAPGVLAEWFVWDGETRWDMTS